MSKILFLMMYWNTYKNCSKKSHTFLPNLFIHTHPYRNHLCWYYLFIDNKVDIKYNFKIYINFLLCFYVVASLFFYWVLWVETHKSFWVCVLFFHVCLSSPLIIQDLFLKWCYFSFNCKMYDIYSMICYEFASPHQRHRHRYWHADVTKLI